MTTTVGNSPMVRLAAMLVPQDIRRDFVGNLLAELAERREAGVGRMGLFLFVSRELLVGFAQHAPLRPAITESLNKPHIARKVTLPGWIAWRLAGPAMLIGWVFSSWALLGLGGFLLVTAYGCLVTIATTGRDPLPERQLRFCAALFGGTLSGLLLVVVFGIAATGLLALASLFSSGLLAGFAAHALVFVAVAVAAGITGSGWVPQEWSPKRLVENRESAPQPG